MGDSSNGVELQVANIDPGIDARDIRQVGCKQVFLLSWCLRKLLLTKLPFRLFFVSYIWLVAAGDLTVQRVRLCGRGVGVPAGGRGAGRRCAGGRHAGGPACHLTAPQTQGWHQANFHHIAARGWSCSAAKERSGQPTQVHPGRKDPIIQVQVNIERCRIWILRCTVLSKITSFEFLFFFICV